MLRWRCAADTKCGFPGPRSVIASDSWHPSEAPFWEGVALRRTRAAADPDSPLRAVALPLPWDGEAGAAAALASLVPGPARFRCRAPPKRGSHGSRPAADDRPRRSAARAAALPSRLPWQRNLARRCGKVRAAIRAEPAGVPGADGGFDAAGYAGACAVAIRALHCLCGGRARRLRLGFADLAGLLARLGLPYNLPMRAASPPRWQP